MNHPLRIFSVLPVFLLSTLLLSGCGWIWEPGNRGSAPTLSRIIQIQADHGVCSTAADCVMVQDDCSECSCGAAIHRDYLDETRERYTEHCGAYAGTVCDFYCPIEKLVCRSGQCEFVPGEE